MWAIGAHPIKDILKHIPYDCKTLQFVDDFVLICSYRDLNKITNSPQLAFNWIQIWLESISLELSLTKSQFAIFHRSRANITTMCLRVNNGIIPISSNVKYLGLYLDTRLRRMEHIKFLRSRSAKYINILKWLVGKGWDISPSQVIFSFANTTIIAQLLWGTFWFITSAYKVALSLPRSASNKTGLCPLNRLLNTEFLSFVTSFFWNQFSWKNLLLLIGLSLSVIYWITEEFPYNWFSFSNPKVEQSRTSNL